MNVERSTVDKKKFRQPTRQKSLNLVQSLYFQVYLTVWLI